jgi:hypothetical protein
MPGIGELIEGAMQQAPQPERQLMGAGGAVIRKHRRWQQASILPAKLD